MQLAVAKKVIGDVITISPDCQPNANPVKCNAAVPLDTAQTCFAPKYFCKSSSKIPTAGPCVSQSPLSTSTTASMSPCSMVCLP